MIEAQYKSDIVSEHMKYLYNLYGLWYCICSLCPIFYVLHRPLCVYALYSLPCSAFINM